MVDKTTTPQRSPLSYADESGPVYFTPERVFRAVPPESAPRMRALMESGLPAALAERGLMPTSQVSTQRLPDSNYVIEHPRLPFVSYPYEWSYGMLRAAAACVLEVNEIANRHGYELADCHAFNVVFDGPQPKYVDLGSLAPRPAGARDWLALDTFARSYEYPLHIWSGGGGFIARRLMAASDLMSHADYGLYRWPWLRGGAAGRYEKWKHYLFRYRQISRVPLERTRARLPLGTRWLANVLHSGSLPGQTPNLSRVRARLLGRNRAGPEGSWSGYQGDTASFVETPRFKRVAEIVGQQGLGSVLELAGNQGFFCDLLLKNGAVKEAICTDYEEAAIDRAYTRAAQTGSRLRMAVLDVVHPMTTPFGDPPPARLKCDGVVALALLHHLLLSQRVPLERVLKNIASYARSFVAVEFMPLGLWDGKNEPPPVPAWYSLEWFRAAFAQEFELTHDESLEKNRHLFCGRIRSSPTLKS